MAQGFDKARNLNESSLPSRDERIVNNLYGDSIADDLRLFIGNLRNESKIPESAYDLVEDSTGSLTIIEIKEEQSRYVGLSNRTKIKIVSDGFTNIYTVTDSDGQRRFSLKEPNGEYLNFTERYGGQKKELVREDKILYENFINFKRPRLDTTTEDPNNDEEIIDGLTTISDDVYDPNTSASLFTGVYDTITYFQFKKSQVLLTYLDNDFYQRIRVNGTIRLTNDDEIERPAPGSTEEDAAPGLFITDLQGNPYRAFSDMYNPWQETGTSLQSFPEVTLAEVAYLVLGDSSQPGGVGENPRYNININSGNVINTSDSGNLTDEFNNDNLYKLKVFINDEPYYLFMKQ